MMRIVRNSPFFALISLLFCLIMFPCSGLALEKEQKPYTKKILLVSSFHTAHSWCNSVISEITQALDAKADYCILDYIELNAQRNRTIDFDLKFEPSLKLIEDGKYDMVIALLDDAVKILTKYSDRIPESMPIVVCGLGKTLDDLKRKHPNTSGVETSFAIADTLKMGFDLMPDAEQALVIFDDLPVSYSLFQKMQEIAKTDPVLKRSSCTATEILSM